MKLVIFIVVLDLLFLFICYFLSSKSFNKASNEACYKINMGHELFYDTLGCLLLALPHIVGPFLFITIF